MSRFAFHRQAISLAFRCLDSSSPERRCFEAAYSRASLEIVNCFFQLFDLLSATALPQEARIIGGGSLPSIPGERFISR
jgi:hypothetical protein